MGEERKNIECPFANEIKELRDKAENRDYWRELYFEEERKNDEWCETQTEIVKNLLNTESSKSLHDLLQELYIEFRYLQQPLKGGDT